MIKVRDKPRRDIQGAHELGMGMVRLMREPNRIKPDIVDPDFKIRNLSDLKSILHARAMLISS